LAAADRQRCGAAVSTTLGETLESPKAGTLAARVNVLGVAESESGSTST